LRSGRLWHISFGFWRGEV